MKMKKPKTNKEEAKLFSLPIFDKSSEVRLDSKDADLVSGYGRISTTLGKNIAAPRQLSLFDSMPPDERALFVPTDGVIKPKDVVYRDRDGKPLSLSNNQTKMVYALSYAATTPNELSREDVQKKIAALKTLRDDGTTKGAKVVISRAINVKSLAHFIFGRSTAETIEKTGKLLEDLSQIEQSIDFTLSTQTGEKGHYQLTAPLIHLEKKLYKISSEVTSKKGRKNKTGEDRRLLVGATIVYGSAFFHQLDKDFAYITPKLFKLWGARGNGSETELFAILLSDLCSKYRGHYLAARAAESKAKSKGLGKTETETAINDALCYAELSETIKSRVTTDYSTARVQKARYYSDLSRAINVLKEYGIISGASILNKGVAGKEKVAFYFSLDFQQFAKDDSIELGLPPSDGDEDSQQRLIF